MLENLKKRADSFDNWEVEVEKAFEAIGADRYGEHSPPPISRNWTKVAEMN